MVLVKLSFCILGLLYVVGATQFLVSLKESETLSDFYSYNVDSMGSQDVQEMINKSFSIGEFKGFYGELSKQAIARLKKCPLVADLSEDTFVRAFDVVTQEDAPRHLARLSQEESLGDSVSLDYFYESDATAAGVNVYVLDSGITIEHPQFDGRAIRGPDFTDEGLGDYNGHGTHVAGLIGSTDFGVAKNVSLIDIKTLDRYGAGTLTSIIAALDYVVRHAETSGVPSVVNLSLGALKNNILNKAINAAQKTGLVVVVAAGNSNRNACGISPASASRAITVGAIDDFTDALADFSNWGRCVDIFSSGVRVSSLSFFDFEKPEILSGTSMAAPIVSGLASNFLSMGIPYDDIKDYIVALSAKNYIYKPSLFLKHRTPNRIANNGLVIPDESDNDESDFNEDVDDNPIDI